MRDDYIKQHPNTAKLLLCNKAYFALRYSLVKHISELERAIDGTMLSTDVSLKKTLASLKRALKGLQKRFETTGIKIDAMLCAQKLIEIEAQEVKEQPLNYCRYFKGENEYKDKNNGLFGDYERCWIDFLSTDIRYLENQVCEYIYHNLMDFSEYDGVPISLKAILFNRYCHWNMTDVEAFKKWYVKCYLNRK